MATFAIAPPSPPNRGAVNPFSSGRWIMEPKAQNIWGANHASWFYAMGLGGALFLLRLFAGLELGRLFGMSLADLLSLVVIGIGGLILISDLGVPLGFWRVYRNPKTSWISIGFMADMLFVIFAGLWTLADLEIGTLSLRGLPWHGNTPLGMLFQLIAAVSAVVVILYPGIVLASSPAIPFWNSMLLPLGYLASAFASTLGIAYLSHLWSPLSAAQLQIGTTLGLLLVSVTGLIYWLHLLNGQVMGVGGKAAVGRLLRGDLTSYFWLAVLGNILAPLGLLVAAWAIGPTTPTGIGALLLAGLLLQPGNWFAKYAFIKAGVYPPFV